MYGIGNGHAYGNGNGNGNAYGWGNGYDGKPASDILLPYLPIFRNDSLVINQLGDATEQFSSRAMPVNPESDADFHGIPFLPMITGFRENLEGFTVGDALVFNFFGYDVNLATELDESDNIIYRFEFGPTLGDITLVIHPDNSFDYYHNLFLEYWDTFYFYIFSELTNGSIYPDNNSFGYEISGEAYWVEVGYDDTLARTYFNGIQFGKGNLYIKSTAEMQIGIPTPKPVPYELIPQNLAMIDDYVVSQNPIDEVTIDELKSKNIFLKALPYTYSDDFSLNDMYYVKSTETYYMGLVYNQDCYLPEGFKNHIGYSFEELGCPDSNNIIEFIGDYFGLEYKSFGPTSIDDWSLAEYPIWDGSLIPYQETQFTLEQSGLYFIPNFYNPTQVYNKSGTREYMSCLKPLQAGVYTYAIPYDENQGIVLPDYVYWIRIEDLEY